MIDQAYTKTSICCNARLRNTKTCFDKQVKTKKQLQNIFPKFKTKIAWHFLTNNFSEQ